MQHRKSISRELFATIASVLLASTLLMCAMQLAMSVSYFNSTNRKALTAVLNGAHALALRYEERGSSLVEQLPQEAKEDARRALQIFNTATDNMIYVADRDGKVLLSSNGMVDFAAAEIAPEYREKMDQGKDLFVRGKMDGLYQNAYFTVGRKVQLGEREGYLFVASRQDMFGGYVGDMLNMSLLSGGLMLLFASVLSVLLARRITVPIENISKAARQLGSGDFTARAPVGDIEELADFATNFNNMAERLQTIDNSRGQFMGNIAHELRTPMTSIKGFIDGMLDGTIPPEDHQRYLETVSQETGRLARLVQNMLDITKLEAGEYRISARNYDLCETLTGVVLADEQRIEDGKIDIEGLSPDKVMVYADPDLVHQVVYNLVDNAIKFTPEGGVIRFSVRRVGDMVETSVENTGAGIAADALPHVFERFYKEDRSRGLNTRGSGLGLHICQVLIQLSGGQITAASEEGQWCRFTFTLPAAR